MPRSLSLERYAWYLKYLEPEKNDITREPKAPNNIIILLNVQSKKDKTDIFSKEMVKCWKIKDVKLYKSIFLSCGKC